MSISDKTRLKEIILARSLKKGEFILTSGKRSNYYIDCKNTTLHPLGAYLCGSILCEMIYDIGLDVDAVGGLTLGADPIVTSISIVSQLKGKPIYAYIVRKEKKTHGTSSWIEGKENIPKNAKVAVVDDVVTTGGSIIKAIKASEEEGFDVQYALCLVDRREGARENLEKIGIKLYSVFEINELL